MSKRIDFLYCKKRSFLGHISSRFYLKLYMNTNIMATITFYKFKGIGQIWHFSSISFGLISTTQPTYYNFNFFMFFIKSEVMESHFKRDFV